MAAGRPDPDLAALGALAQIAAHLTSARGGDLSYGSLKRAFRELAVRDPIDSLLATVLGGAYLFYLIEKDKNPKCQSFWDALVFISTSLSVGYDDVFARTEPGKAIASFIMTFGPALAAAAFDPPAEDRVSAVARRQPLADRSESAAPGSAESIELQKAIVSRLDAILLALRALPQNQAPAR